MNGGESAGDAGDHLFLQGRGSRRRIATPTFSVTTIQAPFG